MRRAMGRQIEKTGSSLVMHEGHILGMGCTIMML